MVGTPASEQLLENLVAGGPRAVWQCHVPAIKTHQCQDQMALILQTIFWNTTSWSIFLYFLFKFHWSVCFLCLNSLRPSDAYMRHQPRPWMVQIMACRLFGAKPLSEPMPYYCQLDPLQQTSIELYLKCKHFHSRKRIWKCRLGNVGHFVPVPMC